MRHWRLKKMKKHAQCFSITKPQKPFKSIRSEPKAYVLYLFIFSTFIYLFIYFWDRERQSMNGGGAEREGDTESETGSKPSAQSPTRGLNSRTARSWPGWSRTLNRLRHPGAPCLCALNQAMRLFLSKTSFTASSCIWFWALSSLLDPAFLHHPFCLPVAGWRPLGTRL